MEVRILYLDVDDEITTAASRVRATDGTRVAMVLPNGSRVSTSRINFRLLARDATVNGKRLSIVAADAATRALAASAGIPIFATVAEYESSIAEERASKATAGAGEETAPTASSAALAGAAGAAGAADATATGAAAPGAADAIGSEGATPAPATRSTRGAGGRKPRGSKSSGDETMTSVVTAPVEDASTAGPGAAAAISGAAAAGSTAVVNPPPPPAPLQQAHRAPAAVPAARVVADTPVEPLPVAPVHVAGSRVLPAPDDRRWGGRSLRTPLLVGAGVLALAVVVGGVGAYLFLPTATAIIAPRETTIGPVALRIVASPTATEPDPVAKTVPAMTTDVDVETNQTFPVTGKRVEESEASGTVRFRNKDFTATNTIPRGSIVSTGSGVRFRTDRSVTVPRAELVGLQIFPASANVKVTAVNPGPAGNVEPNTILVIPRGEDPLTLDVTNPDETSGGKREEFPRVVQADLDAATKALDAALASAFAAKLADPALVGEGMTAFPETASLGETTLTSDPKALLGDEIETFDLGATARGTVLAVDESSVQTVAEANIEPQVQDGYALVEGSSQVDASPGLVENGVITFPATITARQVLQIDPTAIEAEIRGKSLDEARSILDGYGRTELSVWPDWVGAIPTLDARVDVRTATEAAP